VTKEKQLKTCLLDSERVNNYAFLVYY